jgi:hypothetical protein
VVFVSESGYAFRHMTIPWHRFLKIGLRHLFSGTCFEVYDEFDLSDQVQRVDFAVIRVANHNLPPPAPEKMPDGLQTLRSHNLISYKSINEPFDRFALNELIGHAVAYSKLQARDDWKTFSDSLGLIALSTRKPQTEVISRLLQQTANEDVYEIDCAGWKVTCIVINMASPEKRNWLWALLKGDKSRWKSGTIAVMLKAIKQQLKEMGNVDPEIEAFETEILESWLQELPPSQRLIGLDLKATPEVQALIDEGIEQGIEQGRIAGKMIEAGKSNQEIAEVTKLSIKTIDVLRKKIETEG